MFTRTSPDFTSESYRFHEENRNTHSLPPKRWSLKALAAVQVKALMHSVVALCTSMYERFLDNLWYSIPFMTLLMILVWYRNRAVKKGWVTQERFDEILSQVSLLQNS